MIHPLSYERPHQPTLWPTSEPPLRFVLKLHQASNLHFDLRLEIDDMLLSWVLHERPSLNPAVRLRAVQVPHHSPKYMHSERRIPEGQYGAGPTIVWECGTYAPLLLEDGSQTQALRRAYRFGRLEFELCGKKKLNGGWLLERDGNLWSFSKLDDAFTSAGDPDWDDLSVLSGKSLDQI